MTCDAKSVCSCHKDASTNASMSFCSYLIDAEAGDAVHVLASGIYTWLLKATSANGVGNQQNISSLCWVGKASMKASFFAGLVVKHLCAPLPVLLAAK